MASAGGAAAASPSLRPAEAPALPGLPGLDGPDEVLVARMAEPLARAIYRWNCAVCLHANAAPATPAIAAFTEALARRRIAASRIEASRAAYERSAEVWRTRCALEAQGLLDAAAGTGGLGGYEACQPPPQPRPDFEGMLRDSLPPCPEAPVIPEAELRDAECENCGAGYCSMSATSNNAFMFCGGGDGSGIAAAAAASGAGEGEAPLFGVAVDPAVGTLPGGDAALRALAGSGGNDAAAALLPPHVTLVEEPSLASSRRASSPLEESTSAIAAGSAPPLPGWVCPFNLDILRETLADDDPEGYLATRGVSPGLLKEELATPSSPSAAAQVSQAVPQLQQPPALLSAGGGKNISALLQLRGTSAASVARALGAATAAFERAAAAAAPGSSGGGADGSGGEDDDEEDGDRDDGDDGTGAVSTAPRRPLAAPETLAAVMQQPLHRQVEVPARRRGAPGGRAGSGARASSRGASGSRPQTPGASQTLVSPTGPAASPLPSPPRLVAGPAARGGGLAAPVAAPAAVASASGAAPASSAPSSSSSSSAAGSAAAASSSASSAGYEVALRTRRFTTGWGGFAPTVGIVYDDAMLLHEEVPGTSGSGSSFQLRVPGVAVPRPLPSAHPERPDRLRAIAQHLVAAGLFQRCKRVPVRLCHHHEVAGVHTEAYLETLERLPALVEEGRGAFHFGSDTFANRHTLHAAKLACGATLAVTEEVARGKVDRGVALVRPPGHHAEPDAAMGFCFYNNVAVAAWAARTLWGCKRVMIVDWDVHHGNGIENMFYDDPGVLYVSLHRHDHGAFYPGTGHAHRVGSGRGAGYNLNVPWNREMVGDPEYLQAFDDLIMPVAHCYDPDLVLVAAGFDAARNDPLGGCDVTPAGYAHMTHRLLSVARGRCVIVLEGGYNLATMSQSVEAVTRVLLGQAPPPLLPVPPVIHASSGSTRAGSEGAEGASAARAAAPSSTAAGPASPSSSTASDANAADAVEPPLDAALSSRRRRADVFKWLPRDAEALDDAFPPPVRRQEALRLLAPTADAGETIVAVLRAHAPFWPVLRLKLAAYEAVLAAAAAEGSLGVPLAEADDDEEEDDEGGAGASGEGGAGSSDEEGDEDEEDEGMGDSSGEDNDEDDDDDATALTAMLSGDFSAALAGAKRRREEEGAGAGGAAEGGAKKPRPM